MKGYRPINQLPKVCPVCRLFLYSQTGSGFYSFTFNTVALTIFETAGLLVRPFDSADADSFFLINSNEQVMRYIRPVKSRADCDAFLAENIRLYKEMPGTGRWAVVEKKSGQVIGTFSLLLLDKESGTLHIGYALLPAYWNQGYATVLLKAGSAYFFENNPHKTLYAITRKENTASEKVLQKCGFEWVKEYEANENLWKKESNSVQ